MKPINIKIMMALIEKEPGDQYVPVLKPVLMQILTELKHLRRMNVLNTKSVQIAHSSFRVKISTAAFSLGILSTGS